MDALAATRQGRATFTPFLSETARLQELKNIYIDELHDFDLSSQEYRERVIKTARSLAAEIIGRIGDQEQWNRLNAILESMKNQNMMLSMYHRDMMLVEAFRDEAYNFQNAVNMIMQANNLGLKLTSGMSELTNLARYMGADTFHLNKQGIPIDYNLDTLTWYWNDRVNKELDNFWAFEGKEGYGKTTLAMEAASTYLEHQGREFTLNGSMFFNESKERVYNTLRKDGRKGDIYIFDEAVNQANKKQWWKTDQVELMNLFTLMRYRGVTVIFCIPSAMELDVVLRNHRLHGIVSIPDRGIAVVKVPNLNPSAPTYQMEGYAKQEVVQSPDALAGFMSAFDKNRVLDFPFVPIPKDLPLWKQYMALKETSVTSRKMNKDFIRRSKPKAPIREQIIIGLLLSLDPKVATVNMKQVDEYSVKIGYKITLDAIARYIARRTGISPSEMIKIPNASKSKDINADAFIDLTEPHIVVFINNLRSQERDKK